MVAVLAGCTKERLPLIEITVGGHPLRVEVASTPEARNRGLMYRRHLGEDEGMLFVYDEPQELRFWMKNTHIPLSIAFIDEDGVITQIEDMEPHWSRVRSTSLSSAALEVSRGWFRNHAVGDGARLEVGLGAAHRW